ncbi:MAG: hypothetical protein M3M93_03435, partial [Actinomycetota bacterium]|nr:hypothetical protein [Actinomycetota bacterium]
VQVPQAVLDAIADAETDESVAATQAEGMPVEEAEVTTATQATAEAGPVETGAEPIVEPAEPEAPPQPEAPPEPEAAPEPEPPAEPEAPGTDEEVSLEAILEDLKRREGRSE